MTHTLTFPRSCFKATSDPEIPYRIVIIREGDGKVEYIGGSRAEIERLIEDLQAMIGAAPSQP